jgi:hypothetical protein
MPDEAEMGGYSGSDKKSWAGPVVGAVVLMGLLGIVVVGLAAMMRHDIDRNKFLGMCIEFHPIERCSLLYSYDRRDLAMPAREMVKP